MDAIGFALATAFLATVFTVFGVIDRLLVGLVSEIRYTIAPGIANGMRAWGNASGGGSEIAPSDADDQAPGGTDVTDRRSAEPESPASTASVRPVTRHGWLFFARLPHATAGIGH